MVMHIVRSSATATDDHIPFMPNIIGSRSTADNWNTRVRRNDIAADMGPLFNAVKNDEPNMLQPFIRNTKQYILNPMSVISYNERS